jgi:hypothetical protein
MTDAALAWGAPQADSPIGGHGSPICWYRRSGADGNATWGPTSRPVPQWTRPSAGGDLADLLAEDAGGLW